MWAVRITVDSHAAEAGYAHLLKGRLPEGSVHIQQLSVGDIWIETCNQRYIIERKSLSDLAGSLKCGNRLFEQIARMKQAVVELGQECTEFTTTLFLLVSGNAIHETTDLYGVSASCLFGALDVLQLKKDIKILTCQSGDQTVCARLVQLVKRIVEDIPDERDGDAPSTFSMTPVGQRMRSHSKNDANMIKISILCGIPGISLTTSKALLTHFKTIRKIAKAKPEVLAEVQLGYRRLGKTLATRIHTSLNE